MFDGLETGYLEAAARAGAPEAGGARTGCIGGIGGWRGNLAGGGSLLGHRLQEIAMSRHLFTTVAVLGLAFASPAVAQTWAHEPGTGESGPASSTASNIGPSDTHSDIAPHFPEPAIGQAGSPEQYLMEAQHALAGHRTGEAQQALEMAETRLLDRSTPVNAAGQPDSNPMVASVAAARDALGRKDWAAARHEIETALSASPAGK